jgi:hypothetical protein
MKLLQPSSSCFPCARGSIICDDSIADELWESIGSAEHKALL